MSTAAKTMEKAKASIAQAVEDLEAVRSEKALELTEIEGDINSLSEALGLPAPYGTAAGARRSDPKPGGARKSKAKPKAAGGKPGKGKTEHKCTGCGTTVYVHGQTRKCPVCNEVGKLQKQ